jgi:glycosyltransferase involved in cell wall biosynthesis
MTSTHLPYITVVLTAFNRKTYLKRALSSVLDQTLPRTHFEVILIKNFVDSEIDAIALAGGVRIFQRTGSIGKWYAFALEIAQGDILTFLDDDDEYRPERLARIQSEFAADGTLCYYENGRSYIDDENRPLSNVGFKSRPDQRLIRIRKCYVPDQGKGDHARQLLRLHPGFNESSIAIRKSTLFPHRDILERVVGGQDLFIFYCALISTSSILIDWQPLTRFRIHKRSSGAYGSVHGLSDLARQESISRGFLATHRLIVELLQRKDLTVFREAELSLESIWQIMVGLHASDVSRARMASYVLGSLRRTRATLLIEFWPLILAGQAYVWWPRLARFSLARLQPFVTRRV